MTLILHAFNSLRSSGLRFGVLAGLLVPSSAQQTAAPASAAVGRVHKPPRFPQQAACLSTSSWLQLEHTFKSAEAKDQALQQLMEELLPQLESLGVTPPLLRKVLMCRGSPMKASTAHHLKGRFENFYQLAAADTQEQRTSVNKQLSHAPMLLALQARQVAANAAELRNILCQQFNVSETVVQQLITKQITVLKRKPQAIADKLQGWASILQLDVGSVVQDVWCKFAGTQIDRASTSVAAAFQHLQSVLQLGTSDVLHLALTQPGVLTSVSEHKLQVLSQLLGSYGWTQQQLGQAVLKYPTVLANSVDSFQHKWEVFHQYAAAHPPSQQQLQDKCKDSVMLCIFRTSKATLQLMQYIMQYHKHAEQQRHGHLVSSPTSITQRLVEQTGQHRRKQSKVGSRTSSATTSLTSVASLLHPHRKRPLVWCFTRSQKDNLVKLAVDYPGFAEWLKQQQG